MFIATNDDKKVVGVFGSVFVRRFSSKKDKMRGTGLGYALYSEIINTKRPRRVRWNARHKNTPAIEFYEKSGAKVL
jgi:GNAT superfamily N-acetyltransferase